VEEEAASLELLHASDEVAAGAASLVDMTFLVYGTVTVESMVLVVVMWVLLSSSGEPVM